MLRKLWTQALGLWMDYRVWRALALGWMTLIFLLSSKSDLPVPPLFPLQDKIEHGVAFGILGVLFQRSCKPCWTPPLLNRILVITAMVAAYGAFDEIHQSFVPARDASLADFAADALGGMVSAILLSFHDRTEGAKIQNPNIEARNKFK
jgi:VanZ family protein